MDICLDTIYNWQLIKMNLWHVKFLTNIAGLIWNITSSINVQINHFSGMFFVSIVCKLPWVFLLLIKKQILQTLHIITSLMVFLLCNYFELLQAASKVILLNKKSLPSSFSFIILISFSPSSVFLPSLPKYSSANPGVAWCLDINFDSFWSLFT